MSNTDRSVHELLAAAGYTHRRDERSRGPGAHSIYDAAGNFVGSMCAESAAAFVKARGEA